MPSCFRSPFFALVHMHGVVAEDTAIGRSPVKRQGVMACENSAVACQSRARSLVNRWRREHGPDEGEALADAREAYLKCMALNDSSGDDLTVQAKVGLAKLDFVAGDPASMRSALARLSEAMRDHPYSNNIEEVIYLLAIQAAFPSTGQPSATAMGALEYLDYLRESYAPAHEGAPTACLYPRWDSGEEDEAERQQDGGLVGPAESWRGQGLHIHGLPAWALQFQIGLLASRMGKSTRGMETMENAFTSYEAWLPRSRGNLNDDTPDVDAIRRVWYNGLPHWTAWVQHPRTWLDLGDISYRQGPGYFHVAAEAYRGALQRAGDVFRPDQQETIAYRIAKCGSRYGDTAGAIAGVEQLLYTRNFWSEKYRNHLKTWSESWREHFIHEDMASLTLQCFWRVAAAKMELRFLRAQDRLIQEYTELKRRNVLKHHFLSILEYCRERRRISKFATDIQCMYRVHKARTIASTLRSVRDFQDAIVQAHVSKLIRNFQAICFKHWVQHHGLVELDKAAARIQALLRGKKARVLVQSILASRNSQARLEQLVAEMHYICVTRRCMRRLSKQVVIGRRERAATTIQAMARGVAGREVASDERNRRAGINQLLLKALTRLGMPVLREWHKAAHDARKARMATRIQARWRTFRARRKWTTTKTKVFRAREMGIVAIGRHQRADKRRVLERWKHVVLVRKIVTVQQTARVWLAKRVAARKRRRKEDLECLFNRVMKPVRRQCFVALVRNGKACRKEKGNRAIAIQCWWRCHLAVASTQKVREYRGLIQKAYETVASNRDRRLLARCCREWRENIPKQKAAAKIQAAWRGWQGRLRAAWFRDRQARFEVAVGVLRAVFQRRVREYAFEEWRVCAWCGRMVTTLAARFRGWRARKAYAERLSLLRAQQDALCRAGLAKRRLYLAVAVREWSDYCWCCAVFSVFQARIRGWRVRRRLATIKFFAQGGTEMVILDGIRNHRHLNVKCCAAQAAWRGSIARGRRHRVLARARVVGEIFDRISDSRRRRVLDATFSTWCSTRFEEKRMAVRLQCLVRGRRERARVCLIRAHERWRNDLVATFLREVRRRRMLRCFRAIETYLVDAYTKMLRSFLSYEKKQTAVPAEQCGSIDKGEPSRNKAWEGDGVESTAPKKGNYARCYETNTNTNAKTAAAPSDDADPHRGAPACSKRESTKTIFGRSRCARRGNAHLPRRPRRVGRDIVWEEEDDEEHQHQHGGGGGCKHRDLVACALWKTTWVAARERSTAFLSPAFFRAFDEVRRMGLLRWLPARLSYQELAYLCRFARVISFDRTSAVEVWKFVEVLRQAQRTVACAGEKHPPTEVLEMQATIRPAVVICNGDYADKIRLGQAVGALVDDGNCSSLSITACSLGNVGAAALAKACCRKGLEELCLVSCDIGNAGAAALLVALGEGAGTGLRKLVLSGNRVGGIVAFARALRNVMTRRECSLEVLELSSCSIDDSDMTVLCKGLEDARCRIRVLLLSNNADLRDRGATVLAKTLRTRSEVRTRAHQASLQVDLERCSIHTWGCLALAACILDANGLESEESLVLNLGTNLIKDYGVEAMSCATLGQDYNDHRKRQGQQHRRSKSPRVLNGFDTNLEKHCPLRAIPHGATKINEAAVWAQQSGFQDKEHPCATAAKPTLQVVTKDLPPLKGTPLYAAATAAAWPSIRHQSPRKSFSAGPSAWSVVLDGNKVSDRVIGGQGALARLGEAGLFRGCVLPETVAANKSWGVL